MNREIVEVSKDAAWSGRLQGARASLNREPPSLYYDALESVAAHIDLWETIYHHILPGPQAVLEWFAASACDRIWKLYRQTRSGSAWKRCCSKGTTRCTRAVPADRSYFRFAGFSLWPIGLDRRAR